METAKQKEEASKVQLRISPMTIRLEASMGKEFEPVDQRVFFAKNVMFVGAHERPLYIRIAGAEPLVGKELIIKNTKNPNNLRIAAEENIMHSKVDAGVFLVPKGEAIITAERSFKALNDLDSAKGQTLAHLPSKDPDEVVLDNRVFLQTGTICVQGRGMFMVIGESKDAIGGD